MSTKENGALPRELCDLILKIRNAEKNETDEELKNFEIEFAHKISEDFQKIVLCRRNECFLHENQVREMKRIRNGCHPLDDCINKFIWDFDALHGNDEILLELLSADIRNIFEEHIKCDEYIKCMTEMNIKHHYLKEALKKLSGNEAEKKKYGKPFLKRIPLLEKLVEEWENLIERQYDFDTFRVSGKEISLQSLSVFNEKKLRETIGLDAVAFKEMLYITAPVLIINQLRVDHNAAFESAESEIIELIIEEGKYDLRWPNYIITSFLEGKTSKTIEGDLEDKMLFPDTEAPIGNPPAVTRMTRTKIEEIFYMLSGFFLGESIFAIL